MSEDLCWLGATDAARLIRQKDLSPLELTRALLQRIEDHDGALNSFINLTAERALAAAAVFLVLAIAAPRLLRPLNRLWHRFGLLLARFMNLLVLGLLFYFVITPMGLIMRMAGKDPLRLRWRPEADSYWIERAPPGPKPETMKNQF